MDNRIVCSEIEEEVQETHQIFQQKNLGSIAE